MDTNVAQWDTDVVGVDQYGPIHERAIPTWGHPIEAAVYFAGVNHNRYPEAGKSPFHVLDQQKGQESLSYRAYETGGYLNAVHYESKEALENGQASDSDDRFNWRQTNKLLTDAHREFAQQIRDYYTSKLTMWKMRDRELTAWQTELFNLVTSEDPSKFRQRDIGMISKIVQTYEIDQETDRCVAQWGAVDTDGCPNFYDEHCTAVGATHRLNKGGISLFVITERRGELVELVLCKSPVNRFFIDTIRNQSYTGFKFSAMQSKLYDHIGGRKWFRVYSPRIEVA